MRENTWRERIYSKGTDNELVYIGKGISAGRRYTGKENVLQGDSTTE